MKFHSRVIKDNHIVRVMEKRNTAYIAEDLNWVNYICENAKGNPVTLDDWPKLKRLLKL